MCFKTLFTKNAHFLSISDMCAVSSACNVRHLCPSNRAVSITNFKVSSVRVTLSRGIQVFSMGNTIFTSQVSFQLFGKGGILFECPFNEPSCQVGVAEGHTLVFA